MKRYFLLIALCYTQLSFAQTENNKLYYHLSFPAQINEQSEKLTLDKNYHDLIMTNLIAGSLYAYLLHEKYPDLKFNDDYIIGSIFSQLLQENLQTNDYRSNSSFINPDANIRNMLLAPGQGGPYQLNDYSKRLENKIGLINFVTLQKKLGYKIQDQDNGTQTNKIGPVALDDKFFAPLATAYFQFNNMLRLEAINREPWGPSYHYYNSCMQNLETNKDQNNILDMILNATYNAGPYADITKTYIEICANTNNMYVDKIANINNYFLDDSTYQKRIGTHESVGSTYILYPRQIRFYSDELFNNKTGLNLNNSISINLNELQNVFALSFSTLAYIDINGEYSYINMKTAEEAFHLTRIKLNLTNDVLLNLGNQNDRKKLFELLQQAIKELASTLDIDFTNITENNLN